MPLEISLPLELWDFNEALRVCILEETTFYGVFEFPVQVEDSRTEFETLAREMLS